ncbi:signal peptidase I [Lysobacteraceae bacterium NML120232]|nr:signal peptidase I [Xanthomonadaceae bacterium NML08-0793]PJK12563.1 signal peptidase I [Xanthomonadaceae bacterium NML120232]
MRWFELVMVILTLLTGLIWLADRLWLKKRREAAGLLAEDEPWYVDYSRAFFPILLVILLLRSFIIDHFRVPTGSMIPTIQIGDFIVVNKFAYGLRLPVTHTKIIPMGEPRRGDVVVFTYPGMSADDPDAGIDFVKRVVGLPGDTVRYERGVLSINGEPLHYQNAQPVRISGDMGMELPGIRVQETLDQTSYYIQHLEYNGMADGEFVVPAGHYFVMGDNRDNSLDSRFWGFLPEANLRGKAFLVWMNFKDFSRVGEKVQ